MASIEKLPPFMTVGTSTARTAPESFMSVVTDAEGMAKNGVETLEMLMLQYLFPQGKNRCLLWCWDNTPICEAQS